MWQDFTTAIKLGDRKRQRDVDLIAKQINKRCEDITLLVAGHEFGIQAVVSEYFSHAAKAYKDPLGIPIWSAKRKLNTAVVIEELVQKYDPCRG
jgi:hypothetical protein